MARMFRITLGLAAGVMALAAPVGAQVAPVVVAASSSDANGGPVSQYNHQTITASGTYQTSSEGTNVAYQSHGESSSALAIDTNGRSIASNLQASGYGFTGANADSQTQITFSFVVNGPTPTVAIDLSAIATLSRSAFDRPLASGEPGPSQGQYAYVDVVDDLNHSLFGGFVTSGFAFYERSSTVTTAGMFTNTGATVTPIGDAFAGTFQGLKTGTIDTGRVYSIRMILQDSILLGNYSGQTESSLSSYASLSDLNVSINSAFASPADYRIDFGPESAVPEPASWAMFILGFGLTGAAVRRRKAGALRLA